MSRLENFYVIGKKLGEGSRGVVHEVIFKVGTGRRFAAKVCRSSVEYEAGMQVKAACNGTVALVDMIEEVDDGGSLVLDLYPCSLKDRLSRQGRLGEGEVARVIWSLASTLGIIHKSGVVHRDLKLDNIMMTSESPPYDVKIGEDNEADMKELCGTVRYMAPEVAMQKDRYTKAVDVWGLGLVMYELVTGLEAFGHVRNDVKMVDFLANLTNVESELDWRGVSGLAKELILGMLAVDPYKRMNVDEVLSHDWIRSNTGLGNPSFVPLATCSNALEFRRADRSHRITYKLL